MATRSTVVMLDKVLKRFGDHTALSDLDLQIPQGSAYGLLGPNGSGEDHHDPDDHGILIPDAGRVVPWRAQVIDSRRIPSPGPAMARAHGPHRLGGPPSPGSLQRNAAESTVYCYCST